LELGQWCHRQRVNELEEDQIKLLKQIGFIRDPKNVEWEDHYDALINFKKVKGESIDPPSDCLWSMEILDHDNNMNGKQKKIVTYNLGNWCNVQNMMIKNNKLSKEREKRLKSIGFGKGEILNKKINEFKKNAVNGGGGLAALAAIAMLDSKDDGNDDQQNKIKSKNSKKTKKRPKNKLTVPYNNVSSTSVENVSGAEGFNRQVELCVQRRLQGDMTFMACTCNNKNCSETKAKKVLDTSAQIQHPLRKVKFQTKLDNVVGNCLRSRWCHSRHKALNGLQKYVQFKIGFKSMSKMP
jgi:hypothetical protein